jgi:hypothetical protein
MTEESKANRRWTKHSILDEIRMLVDRSAKQNQRERPSLYGACIRHFGSWKSAVEAAGFDYSISARRKVPGFWDHQRVIEAIRKLPEKNSNHARTKHADLYSAALRHFGSWKDAVEASGMSYDSVRKGHVKRATKASNSGHDGNDE